MAAHEKSFAERGRTDRHGELAPPGREQSVFTDGDAVAEGAPGGRPQEQDVARAQLFREGVATRHGSRCPACVSGHLGGGRPGLLRGHPAVPVPLKCSLGAKGPPGCPGTALTAALTQSGFVALPGAQEVPAAAVLPRSEGGRVLRNQLVARGTSLTARGPAVAPVRPAFVGLPVAPDRRSQREGRPSPPGPAPVPT